MTLWLRILLFGIILKDVGMFRSRPVGAVDNVTTYFPNREQFIRERHGGGWTIGTWRPVKYLSTGQYWKVRGKWRQRVLQLPFDYSIYL